MLSWTLPMHRLVHVGTQVLPVAVLPHKAIEALGQDQHLWRIRLLKRCKPAGQSATGQKACTSFKLIAIGYV